MWLNEFKIAIVQKNVEKINALSAELPVFSDLNEMKEAAYLLCEAQELLLSLQTQTEKSMLQIKRNIKFLKSTQTDAPCKLDLTL